jgi:hypothetical protein
LQSRDGFQLDTLVCSSVYFMLVIKTIQRRKPLFLRVINYGGAKVNQHPPVYHLLDAHYIQEKGSISTHFLCVKKLDFFLSIYSVVPSI